MSFIKNRSNAVPDLETALDKFIWSKKLDCVYLYCSSEILRLNDLVKSKNHLDKMRKINLKHFKMDLKI